MVAICPGVLVQPQVAASAGARAGEAGLERERSGGGIVLAQRPVGRDADRSDRLYQESLDRQRALQQQRQQQQEAERRTWQRNEDARQRRSLEEGLQRSRPSSQLQPLPTAPIAQGSGRSGGCFAMAFDTEGRGLRVTRRGGYERDCATALALCREAVGKGKSARFRTASCRVVAR